MRRSLEPSRRSNEDLWTSALAANGARQKAVARLVERSKRKRLEKAGWRVGTTAEFLELTEIEEALVRRTAT